MSDKGNKPSGKSSLSRRSILLGGGALAAALGLKTCPTSKEELIFMVISSPQGITDSRFEKLKKIIDSMSPEELNQMQHNHGKDELGNDNYFPLLNDVIQKRVLRKNAGADYRNYLELAEYLLKKGINVNSRSLPINATPLMTTTVFSDMEAMDLLIKYKADPNLQSVYGRTAMHLAYEVGLGETVKRKLLDAGARMDIPDINGLTPQMLKEGPGKGGKQSGQGVAANEIPHYHLPAKEKETGAFLA